MPLLDFHSGRRSLDIGGRRFVIRRVTVAAMVRGLTVYAREIAAMRAMHAHGPELFERFGWRAGMLLLPPDARLLDVIRPCVETDVPESEWPLTELAEAIAVLSDWPRIVASLRWGGEAGADSASESKWILDLARVVGASPVEIVDWPYEALVAIDEVSRGADKPPMSPEAFDAFYAGT